MPTTPKIRKSVRAVPPVISRSVSGIKKRVETTKKKTVVKKVVTRRTPVSSVTDKPKKTVLVRPPVVATKKTIVRKPKPVSVSKTKSVSVKSVPVAADIKMNIAAPIQASADISSPLDLSSFPPLLSSSEDTCTRCGHIPMGGPHIIFSVFTVLLFMLSAMLFVAGDMVSRQNIAIANYHHQSLNPFGQTISALNP